MRKYLVEFIGTFFLVLTIGLSQSPLAIGAVLIALVYMGGFISGAHYNPAVTLAVWLRGKMPKADVLPYMGWQLAGAVVAALAYRVIRGSTFTPHPGAGISFGSALLVEVLFTFLLASAVLQTAATKTVKGNEYYGLAIGLVVMAGAFAVGPISGAAFNPAVGVGPTLFDLKTVGQNYPNLALYTLGPFAGAWLASLVHRYVTDLA